VCKRKFWLSAFLAFGVVLAVSSHHLGQFSFWNDEADTAVLSGSILRTGLPSADDGQNVLIFEGCSQLGRRGLLSKKIPWVQYYVAAVSRLIFGEGEAGTRFLFVFLGCLSLFPLSLLLRRSWGSGAPVISALILLGPQTFLFMRNARYYPLLIAEYAFLLWGLFGESSSSRLKKGVLLGSLVLLFETHPVVAVGTAIAVWVFDRSARKAVVLSLGVWGVSYFAVGETPLELAQGGGVQTAAASVWMAAWATLRDLDRVSALPTLGWVALGGIFAARRFRERIFPAAREPAVLFVLATLVAQIAIDSTLIGTETAQGWSVLRYLPHLIVGLGFVLARVLGTLSEWRRGSAILIGVFLMTGWGTLSYWTGGARVWTEWVPIGAELRSPLQDPLRTLYTQVQAVLPTAVERIQIEPSVLDANGIVYLGGRARVRPELSENSACADAVREKLGAERFAALEKPAEARLVFGGARQSGESVEKNGFREIRLKLGRGWLDGSRPELTRHEFLQETGEIPVALWVKASGP